MPFRTIAPLLEINVSSNKSKKRSIDVYSRSFKVFSRTANLYTLRLLDHCFKSYTRADIDASNIQSSSYNRQPNKQEHFHSRCTNTIFLIVCTGRSARRGTCRSTRTGSLDGPVTVPVVVMRLAAHRLGRTGHRGGDAGRCSQCSGRGGGHFSITCC
jgi:hypothetical protein